MATNYKVSIQLDAEGNAVAKFQELNTQLHETKDAAGGGPGGLLGQLGPLGTAVGVLGGAFAALQLGQKALEMRDLGQTVAQTTNTFVALQGGAQAAETTMSSLRAATRGMIEDTTLMSGASQMLRTGVATNNAELAQLIEMAVALKKPTDSAAEALDNFTAMMANQSVLRLDSFGISSGRVTARIEELIAAGQAAGREEAFRMAVLEEGAVAMDRLGDSIEQNASQWDQLMVRGQNAMQGIGRVVYSVGEGIAGALNGIITAVTQGADSGLTAVEEHAQTVLDRAREIRGEYEALLLMGQGTPPSAAGDQSGPLVDPNALLGGVAVDVVGESERASWTATFETSIARWEESNDAVIRTEAQLAQAIDDWQGSPVWSTLPDEIRNAAIFYAQERVGTWGYGPIGGIVAGAEAGGQAGFVRGADPALLRAQQRWLGGEQTQALAAAQAYMRDAIRGQYYTPYEAPRLDYAAIQAQMQDAQRAQAMDRNYSARMYGALRDQREQAAAEWGAGQILDIWGGITDRAASIAGFFDHAFDAAEGIRSKLGEANDKLASSLSAVLGLGVTGGFEGDVYSQIAALIGDEGARTAFEMGTGLTTTGQGAFQDVTGFIAEMSGGAQVQAAQALAAFMQSGRFGADTTQADLMRQIGYFSAPGGGQFQVNAGDTYADLQARYGLTPEEVMQAAGITNSRLLLPGTYGGGGGWQRIVGAGGPEEQGDTGFTQAAADPFEQMAEQARTVTDEVDNIRSGIEGIDGLTASIQFVMSADMPPILQEILGYTSVGQMLTGAVRNNGGTVPGKNTTSSPRTGNAARNR